MIMHNNNSNNNNSNQEQKGNTINNSNTQNTNKNITSVLGENNSKTTNGSLPKTGVTQWLYVLGGVLIVAGIVSYIKYNIFLIKFSIKKKSEINLTLIWFYPTSDFLIY